MSLKKFAFALIASVSAPESQLLAQGLYRYATVDWTQFGSWYRGQGYSVNSSQTLANYDLTYRIGGENESANFWAQRTGNDVISFTLYNNRLREACSGSASWNGRGYRGSMSCLHGNESIAFYFSN